MMFCTNSNLYVNLNSKIIEKIATIYIYKLLECIQWQLMCIATAQRLHTTSHGPQPPSNDPSFLIAFHFEINLISTSSLDLTRTRSCGPHFFYVVVYVMTCFLSPAIYMYRLAVVITSCARRQRRPRGPALRRRRAALSGRSPDGPAVVWIWGEEEERRGGVVGGDQIFPSPLEGEVLVCQGKKGNIRACA